MAKGRNGISITSRPVLTQRAEPLENLMFSSIDCYAQEAIRRLGNPSVGQNTVDDELWHGYINPHPHEKNTPLRSSLCFHVRCARSFGRCMRAEPPRDA